MELKKLTAIVDGVEIELTSEQVEEWCRKKREKENPFNRAVFNQYFYIGWNFNSIGMIDRNGFDDDIRYDAGNYCTDKYLMQQRAYWLQLEQLIWRESWLKNRSKKSKCENIAYSIIFCKSRNEWGVELVYKNIDGFYPEFIVKEDALNAIETIVKPFCKEHPDFRP